MHLPPDSVTPQHAHTRGTPVTATLHSLTRFLLPSVSLCLVALPLVLLFHPFQTIVIRHVDLQVRHFSMMGKSRSATLVIAFLLHQDPTRTSETALESLRSVRSIAEPNDGFMQQLRLYHSMGAPESVEGHPEYQRWLYNRYVQQSIECGQAPENIRFEDEEEPVERTTEGLAFRCRKCSKTLASSRYLIPHDPEPASATQDALRAAATGAISELPASREGGSAVTAPVQCAHFFIDPLIWMQSELYEGKLNGRLECPGCNSSVGKYAWQGMKCSCGKWITPAFSLLRSRIDEMRPRPVISPGGEQARAGAGNRGGFGGKI